MMVIMVAISVDRQHYR